MTEKFVFEHATDNRYYVRDANGAVQPLKPEAVADFLQEAAHCATAHDPAKECPNFCCVLARAVELQHRRFILHSPLHHGYLPLRDEEGNVIGDGAIGRVGLSNVYLRTYAVWPDHHRPEQLEVGECIKGVEYRLSGGHGSYDIYRVR